MNKPDYTHHYRKWHSDTLEHHREMRRAMHKRFGFMFPPDRQVPVLDVGCGTGFLVGALLDHGYANVLGIDIDAGQSMTAQKFNMPVMHVVDTITWLRNRKSNYALITCLDVVEHIPLVDQVRFVETMREALRPDGIFICTVPNANSSFATRWRYVDYTHTSSFSEYSLDFLLHSAGFSQVDIRADEVRPRYPWIPRPKLGWWYLRQMFRGLRRLQLIAEHGGNDGWHTPLSLNLMAIART